MFDVLGPKRDSRNAISSSVAVLSSFISPPASFI